MRSTVFAKLSSSNGRIAAAVFFLVGAMFLVGANVANSTVHKQLENQNITFPAQASLKALVGGTSMASAVMATLSKYAGQQVTTGAQAEVYANEFLAARLLKIGGGKTYAQLSADANSLGGTSSRDATAAATAEAVLQDTTLQSQLLGESHEATLGGVAEIGTGVSLALAGMMVLLARLGVVRTRRPYGADVTVGPQRERQRVLVNA